jgi:electron transport complex protein RnfD
MSDQLVVSSSPHIKARTDTARIMYFVCLALLPTAAASIIIFGLKSLIAISVSVLTCVVTEWITEIIFKREITIKDGSAVVTGMLLAFTLPPTAPFWMVIIGAVVAIFLVKQLFGGLGYNIFNPALAARAVLLTSFPVYMTTWIKPVASFLYTADAATAVSSLTADGVTAASYLGLLKEGLRAGAVNNPYSYWDLFFGFVPGSLGETCKLTLLIGAAFLLLIRIIDWKIPLPYIATVAILSFCFGRDPLAAVLSGGLILGAFFMATDMVTSPTTRWGKIIFGIGCGVITALIRSYGGFPEGVCYSIILMNCLTPLLDKYVRPRVFGKIKAGKKALPQKISKKEERV